MAGFEASADFSNTWGPSLLNTVGLCEYVHFTIYMPVLCCCCYSHALGFESDCENHLLQQITPQRPADQSAYLDPPPGFPKTVGKAARNDQSNSPDDVLASNFGRKLHVDDAFSGMQTVTPTLSVPCRMHLVIHIVMLSHFFLFLCVGNRMHVSQSAQRLGSSGDASFSGRPSGDSEASSQAASRNQQQLPHVGAMTASSSTNSLNNLPITQTPQPDLSRRQHDEDIFSVVGGCELGADSRQHPLQQANTASTNSLGSAAGLPNSSSVGNLSRVGDGATEEQPSRILFVRGLDATVSDEALVHMFEVRD